MSLKNLEHFGVNLFAQYLQKVVKILCYIFFFSTTSFLGKNPKSIIKKWKSIKHDFAFRCSIYQKHEIAFWLHGFLYNL